MLNGLIKESKAKYYKPEGKKRGEWIVMKKHTLKVNDNIFDVYVEELSRREG